MVGHTYKYLPPNFLPRYFFLHVKPPSKRLLNLGVLLMFSSVILCVHKHVHSKSLEPRSLATTKVFVVAIRAYVGSSPVIIGDASCFDVSWLSINASAANFL